MRVWIDQDLCTGDGLCTDHCPEVFVVLEDGISYVRDGAWVGNDPGGPECLAPVPAKAEHAVILAADDCPGECIFLEVTLDADRPTRAGTSGGSRNGTDMRRCRCASSSRQN